MKNRPKCVVLAAMLWLGGGGLAHAEEETGEFVCTAAGKEYRGDALVLIYPRAKSDLASMMVRMPEESEKSALAMLCGEGLENIQRCIFPKCVEDSERLSRLSICEVDCTCHPKLLQIECGFDPGRCEVLKAGEEERLACPSPWMWCNVTFDYQGNQHTKTVREDAMFSNAPPYVHLWNACVELCNALDGKESDEIFSHEALRPCYAACNASGVAVEAQCRFEKRVE